jgi:hypothetical protein
VKGLYGYDYLTAGKNVVALFKNRGWSTFASDRLVYRVLLFAHLSVAILCGGSACLVDIIFGGNVAATRLVSFFIGFILGLLISSTSLFVVESAVRTVIVCFAESPAEFQECHPDLCQVLRQGWAEAYPSVWTAAYEEPFLASAKVVHAGEHGDKHERTAFSRDFA